jgi:hypothetical protein
VGIHLDLVDADFILDKYSEIRRKIWTEIIDPMSRENFRRLHDQDPDTAGEKDPLFQLCRRAENDVQLQREMATVSPFFPFFFGRIVSVIEGPGD